MTNMREVTFQEPTYEEWKVAAESALKGKPFTSLLTKTIEGITLEPLYTKETLLEKVDGKLEEQISTIRTMKTDGAFGVAQEAFGTTIEEFVAQAKESIKRGNEFISVGKVSFEWTSEALQQLGALLSENPFRLNVQDSRVLDVFKYIENKQQVGYVQSNEAIYLPEFPNVRTLSAYTLDAHYEGATSTQELAIALAKAAELVKMSSFEEVEGKIFTSFAVDTHFFMAIAKIRAYRILWKAFAQAYGISNPAPVKILTETSLRSFSKLDVYVNLLRAGNEAFAAVIGGADVLTVHPHNILTAPTKQSVRIARNVALVVKEESHVTKVIDPAGGSYFIETLTNDLVKDAWAYFLKIQDAGGYKAAQSLIEADLKTSWNERIENVKKRKTVLVGTNNYADATEELPKENFVEVNRLAQPFEELRELFTKKPLKAEILAFGELKTTKPRTDFVKGVLATAGIVPTLIEPTTDIEVAKAALASTTADYVVISATDEDTQLIMEQLLASKPEKVLVDVAGKFATDWTEKGLNGYVFAGMDMYEKLVTIHASMKEVQR
ncbi:MAG: methylmalonyl-CoA mutase [Kurthia sp.]|nr:methylmalonyl-CoA mutase [Candidatus Kurthia equi]